MSEFQKLKGQLYSFECAMCGKVIADHSERRLRYYSTLHAFKHGSGMEDARTSSASPVTPSVVERKTSGRRK